MEEGASVAIVQQLLAKRLLLSSKQPLAGSSAAMSSPPQPLGMPALPLGRQLLGPRALPSGSRHWLHQISTAPQQPSTPGRWLLSGGRATLSTLGAGRVMGPQPNPLRSGSHLIASQVAKNKLTDVATSKKILRADHA